MTYADQISRDTERYNPRIERHKNGDVTFRWSAFVHPTKIDDALGLEDMTGRDLHGCPCLDVPARIAAEKVGD